VATEVQTAVTTDDEGHVKGGRLDFVMFILDHSFIFSCIRVQKQKRSWINLRLILLDFIDTFLSFLG